MQLRYVANNDNYRKIPGSIICYWLSDAVLSHLEKDRKLKTIGSAKQGLSTSDNNRFLRFWHEVTFSRIARSCTKCEDTFDDGTKWFPYNKAGKNRKWAPIIEYVVNYQNNGKEIKDTVMSKYPYLSGPGFVVKNTDYYFHHGITWNDVATSSFCCRYVPDGFVFADAGPMFFCDDDFVMMGYFNSNTFQLFADIICQGLHYSTGHIPQMPFVELKKDEIDKVRPLSEENYALSKEDWDSFETSWSFKRHPLV